MRTLFSKILEFKDESLPDKYLRGTNLAGLSKYKTALPQSVSPIPDSFLCSSPTVLVLRVHTPRLSLSLLVLTQMVLCKMA